MGYIAKSPDSALTLCATSVFGITFPVVTSKTFEFSRFSRGFIAGIGFSVLIMTHSGSIINLGTSCIIVTAVPSSKSARKSLSADFTWGVSFL